MDEKKIENMAGVVCSEINAECVGHCNWWYCDECIKIAKAYYNAGYRKESDTAKEILTLIKNGVNLNGMIEGDAKIAIMNELRWAGQKYGVDLGDSENG